MKVGKKTKARASMLSIGVEKGQSEMKIIEKVVGGILTSMKRYPSNENVQHKSIDVMKKMAKISPVLVDGMLKKGATR